MADTFWIVMLAALLACAVTTIGICVISKYKKWGVKYIAYFMAFAAGVLISVSFMHIVPESFGMSRQGPIFLLAGFLLLHVFGLIIGYRHGDEKKLKEYNFGIIPMLGIGLHSFVDGIIYSVTFSVSVFTGALAAIGMVLHEFPEGIITFLFLLKGGFRKNKAMLYAFLAAAVSTPLGALVSYPFISQLKGEPLGMLLAVSAGALIYVGATHLLPAVKEEKRKHTLFALAAGILVAVLIILSKGV